MTVANMIIVQVNQFNEEKRADRLQTNEFVVYNGRIGIVRDVTFVEGMTPDGDVKVTIDVTFKNGTKSPVSHTDTITTTVPRTAIFNTVQMVSK